MSPKRHITLTTKYKIIKAKPPDSNVRFDFRSLILSKLKLSLSTNNLPNSGYIFLAYFKIIITCLDLLLAKNGVGYSQLEFKFSIFPSAEFSCDSDWQLLNVSLDLGDQLSCYLYRFEFFYYSS